MKKLCSECGAENSAEGNFKEGTFNFLLTEKRTILLNEGINDGLIERLIIPIITINQLDDEAEATNKLFSREDNPIHIYINTHGGNVFETMSAISCIMESKTPVYTYAMGKAFSGGFYILVAGDRRFSQKYGTLCYHQMQTQPPRGALQSNKEDCEESIRLQEMLDDFVLSRTKIKSKDLKAINDRKIDWYMGAEEAHKLNVIHELYY